VAKWTAEELVSFVAKVLYEVVQNELTLDYAFQKVKRRWRALESFKVFYDASFDAVRHYYFLRFAASKLFGSSGAKAAAKAWFLYRADSLLYNKELVARYRKRLLKRALAKPEDVEKALEELRGDPARYLSVKYSYHPAIVETLLRYLPLGEVERLLEAGNTTWMWLRINTFKVDVDKGLKLLEQEAEVEPHPHIPFMVLVKKASKPIQYLSAVKTFAAIPQDLASVYTVLALDPRPGDSVLDLAAAPGMKISLATQIAEGKLKVVAADVSRKRVARMRHLLKALGAYQYVDVVHADSRKLAARRFDKALLDAPCTSSGAFTKDPGVKIYPRVERARQYSQLQLQLLTRALQLAEEVVYAVCSILPEEGEEVVSKAGARAEKPLAELAPSYWGDIGGRTFPHIHRSEAFFISRLRP